FASVNHGRPAVLAATKPIPAGKPIAPVIPARQQQRAQAQPQQHAQQQQLAQQQQQPQPQQRAQAQPQQHAQAQPQQHAQSQPGPGNKKPWRGSTASSR